MTFNGYLNGHSFRNGAISSSGTMAEVPGSKLFNDSVHGHICLHPLLVKVIDTPQFQRLRNLKQLGVANYVYPAAGHCRFEHSIGTCYLAGQLVTVLFQREKEELIRQGKKEKLRSVNEIRTLTLCVELAALCHDLGHGPFSHTWEEVVKKWGGESKWKHEESSIQILKHLIQVNKLKTDFEKYLIDKSKIDIIEGMIEGKNPDSEDKENSFLYEIVSNSKSGIDVDKWDYFLRDGQQLNLRITFDYKRILELCAVLTDDTGNTTIAFRDKTIMNLYDMFRVRSDLHYTAYRHKVVVNIECMIIDAFVLAGNAGYPVNNGLSLKIAHTKPEWLSQLSDHIFYDILYSSDDRIANDDWKEAKNLLERILKRQLYTLVDTVNLEEVKPQMKEGKKESRKDYVKGVARKLEAELGPDFRVADFYLDLDKEFDPIKNVVFYKAENGRVEKTKTFEEAQKAIAALPFQLVDKAKFQLLVFHKDEKQKLSSDQKKGFKKLVQDVVKDNGWK